MLSLSQMVEDVGVVAARLFQSVSQNGKAGGFERPARQDASFSSRSSTSLG
jgi:hypothetical protein